MTTGKIIILTGWTFVGKVMSLLFNMLSRLVITFLPRSKSLLISWKKGGFYLGSAVSTTLTCLKVGMASASLEKCIFNYRDRKIRNG